MLAAGTYTVAVSQFANFAAGANLSDGFTEDGNGNFTASNTECTQGSFCDVTGTPTFTNRTNVWAYDILNVASADQVGVAEPATLGLFGLAIAGLGLSVPCARFDRDSRRPGSRQQCRTRSPPPARRFARSASPRRQ